MTYYTPIRMYNILCLSLLIIFCHSTTWAQISFEDPVHIESGAGGIDGIQLEDMNNDGLNDLVFQNNGTSNQSPESDKFYIYYQAPNGTYADTPDASFLYLGTYSGNGFEVEDMDQNGLKDIVHVGQNSIVIAFQDPIGIYTYEVLPVTPSARGLSIGDFNNDSLPDIVWAPIQGKLGIFYQQQDHSYELEEYITNMHSPKLIMSEDINQDGLEDIISGAQIFEDSIFIFLQSDTGMVFPPIVIFEDNIAFTIGDFNNDSYLDLATSKPFDDYIKIWHWDNDSITFLEQYTLPVFQHATSLRVADFNCDGYLDIVSPTSGWQNISVYPGSSLGFSSYISFASSNSQTFLHAIAVGDINNDQFEDIVVGRNALWGGEFFYGNTVPSLGDYDIIDTTTVETVLAGDTLQTFENYLVTTIDSSGDCHIIFADSFQVMHTQYENVEILTEETFQLEAEMCGVIFSNSIFTSNSEFVDIEGMSDTQLIISTVDTFSTSTIILDETQIDTLDQYFFSDSMHQVELDTFTNLDTIFYQVDSFLIVSHFEVLEISTSSFTIAEIFICNETIIDTTEFTEIIFDTLFVSLDTLLISQTINFEVSTGLYNLNTSHSLTVFPNPAYTEIRFELPAEMTGGSVLYSLVDLYGRSFPTSIPQNNQVTRSRILMINTLPPGVYLLLLQDEKHNYYAKFVKHEK